MDNAEIEKLEEFEENRKHEIPPCDLESGNYSVLSHCLQYQISWFSGHPAA